VLNDFDHTLNKEVMMKKLLILTSIGFMTLGGIAFAQSEPNDLQGTPGSIFPYATSSEVQIINGIPCRTVLIRGTGNIRVPIACAGAVGPGVASGEPLVTGSIRQTGRVRTLPAGNPLSGTPGSIFPYAAPNEVQIINGVPCRTVLVQGSSNVRVPIACAW
jgi:hypothetical protein